MHSIYCKYQTPSYCSWSLHGTLNLMQKQKDNEAAEALKMARRKEAMQITKEKVAKPVRMQVGCTPHSSICYSPLRAHGHTLAFGSATPSAGYPVLCRLKLGLRLCGRAHRDGLKHAEPCAVTAHPLCRNL